jgi:hypothetical protein
MKPDHTRSVLLVVAAAMITVGCSRTPTALSAGDRESLKREIVRQEEALRSAKATNDVAALERILADDYLGMNQNGNVRNKAQTLELFRTFPITSLQIKVGSVVVGPTEAVVTGEQDERTCDLEAMLFVHVYALRGGRWQLLSNSQFRRPTDSVPVVKR